MFEGTGRGGIVAQFGPVSIRGVSAQFSQRNGRLCIGKPIRLHIPLVATFLGGWKLNVLDRHPYILLITVAFGLNSGAGRGELDSLNSNSKGAEV